MAAVLVLSDLSGTATHVFTHAAHSGGHKSAKMDLLFDLLTTQVSFAVAGAGIYSAWHQKNHVEILTLGILAGMVIDDLHTYPQLFHHVGQFVLLCKCCPSKWHASSWLLLCLGLDAAVTYYSIQII